MEILIEQEIVESIMEYYNLIDDFVGDSNDFLRDYEDYCANQEDVYDMTYMRKLIRSMIRRGIEDE